MGFGPFKKSFSRALLCGHKPLCLCATGHLLDLMLCTPFVLFFVIVFLSREKPEKQKYKNKTKESDGNNKKDYKDPSHSSLSLEERIWAPFARGREEERKAPGE